jgi:hypothetical protein
MIVGMWISPLSIRITTNKLGSGIAMDNSINIHHWNYFDNEIIPQK